MTEYTMPEERDFIDSWACAHVRHEMNSEQTKKEAREFLARVRRDAQADAWDEGFEVGESNGYAIGRDIDTDENTQNPYREKED